MGQQDYRRYRLRAARFSLLFFWLFSFLHIASSFAAPYPKSEGAVNDFAHVLPSDHAIQLDRLSKELLEKTGTSLVVVTLPDLGGSDIESYATQLYENWGIGKKGEDKGILILLATHERRVRIETGYGVEGELPDGLVGQILDTYALPWLRKGDYGRGVVAAAVATAQVVAQNAGVQLTGTYALGKPRRTSQSWRAFAFPLFFVLFFISFLAGRRTRRLGGFPLVFFPPMGGGRGFGDDDFGGFGGGFGGFGGGMSGGGGASRGF